MRQTFDSRRESVLIAALSIRLRRNIPAKFPAGREWTATLARQPGLEITIDLERQTLLCGTRTYAFSIDAVRRTRLLNGWDDIALTGTYRDRITAFAADDRIRRPWAAPSVRAKFDCYQG